MRLLAARCRLAWAGLGRGGTTAGLVRRWWRSNGCGGGFLAQRQQYNWERHGSLVVGRWLFLFLPSLTCRGPSGRLTRTALADVGSSRGGNGQPRQTVIGESATPPYLLHFSASQGVNVTGSQIANMVRSCTALDAQLASRHRCGPFEAGLGAALAASAHAAVLPVRA